MKPLVRRERADRDVQDAVDYYLQNAPEYALAFVNALEQAYRHIQRQPGTGSPRYAHELNLPGLRFWGCKRFPYLVFYFESADRIDIWRVLHDSRDIPTWLQEST
ncbi:MAG: type II toxin-antitoxin system RelE/ParE family toxin [Sulfuricellaceae bacterium]